MKKDISIKVNGSLYSVQVEPTKTLQDFLREDLNLTGTKKGCDNGDCGSCTILLNGKPILSCLKFAVDVDGCEILTIEGLAGKHEIHPIQQAFIESGAVQCGYCTPGMVLAAKAFLDESPNPTEEEIRQGIAGHLCRCTGYDQIVKAIKIAADYKTRL